MRKMTKPLVIIFKSLRINISVSSSEALNLSSRARKWMLSLKKTKRSLSRLNLMNRITRPTCLRKRTKFSQEFALVPQRAIWNNRWSWVWALCAYHSDLVAWMKRQWHLRSITIVRMHHNPRSNLITLRPTIWVRLMKHRAKTVV